MAGEPKNEAPFTRTVDTSGIADAAKKTLVDPPPITDPTKTGLTTVRSADELGNIATSEVNTDIAGQVAPLQSQYDTLGGQEDRTRSAITSMFGNIMPYVQGA